MSKMVDLLVAISEVYCFVHKTVEYVILKISRAVWASNSASIHAFVVGKGAPCRCFSYGEKSKKGGSQRRVGKKSKKGGSQN